jgi:hypothetical protein
VHDPVELAAKAGGSGGEQNGILEALAEEVEGERTRGH